MNLALIIGGLIDILACLWAADDLPDGETFRILKRIMVVLTVLVLWGALATICQHQRYEKIDVPMTVMKAVTPDGSSTVTYAIDNSGETHRYDKELSEGYTLVNRYIPSGWNLGVWCAKGSTKIVAVKKDLPNE